MSKVRAKNTGPEIFIRSSLFKHGFRYRIHHKKLPGCPDIVLPKFKAVIFVHGCFWHGHNCKAGMLPKTNIKFWKKKILGNIKRDALNKKELEELGWKVLTIWECCLKGSKKKNIEVLSSQISDWIVNCEKNLEIRSNDLK